MLRNVTKIFFLGGSLLFWETWAILLNNGNIANFF
ncbi:hypothetical protein SPLC1_S600040 [Arthrospira platensis C1]|nr:hypothetical protein SPLC1_S600040 [Arthrospira platensis C1]